MVVGKRISLNEMLAVYDMLIIVDNYTRHASETLIVHFKTKYTHPTMVFGFFPFSHEVGEGAEGG